MTLRGSDNCSVKCVTSSKRLLRSPIRFSGQRGFSNLLGKAAEAPLFGLLFPDVI
jgi:hypothetical protein